MEIDLRFGQVCLFPGTASGQLRVNQNQEDKWPPEPTPPHLANPTPCQEQRTQDLKMETLRHAANTF